MLVSFDIDCGELIRGHHFIARGVADCGVLEYEGNVAQGISLEYELVPGVPPQEPRRFFAYMVGVEYEADKALPWGVSDSGAIAPFEGGTSTHGSRGDWPLPEGARWIRFRLRGIDPVTGQQRSADDGILEVDLLEQKAVWSTRTS